MRELLLKLLGCDNVTPATIESYINRLERLERDKNEEQNTLDLFDKIVQRDHNQHDRNKRAMTEAIELITQMREGLEI